MVFILQQSAAHPNGEQGDHGGNPNKNSNCNNNRQMCIIGFLFYKILETARSFDEVHGAVAFPPLEQHY